MPPAAGFPLKAAIAGFQEPKRIIPRGKTDFSLGISFCGFSPRSMPAEPMARSFCLLLGETALWNFVAQPPDLLLRFYVYPLGFGLICSLALRLALYPVSVRRLAGFATPLPPPLTLPSTACGSLHLAVNTRGRTFTCKNCAMPGTQRKATAGSPAMAFPEKRSIIRRFPPAFFPAPPEFPGRRTAWASNPFCPSDAGRYSFW